jgi:microcystin-dependent protein
VTSVIRTSNGNSIALVDGITNRTFSIGLLGKLEDVYDSTLAQNFYQMTENFASPSPPELNSFVNYDNKSNASVSVNPIIGQIWYDTSEGKLKIYTKGLKWESVSKEFNDSDFVPATDNTTDIGSLDKFWKKYYGVHLSANTNRFFGQIGVSDPDGKPAISITGDSVFKNTTKVGVIKSFSGNTAQLGDFKNPIETIQAKKIILGNSSSQGLTIKESTPNNILPYSTGVNFGNSGSPFKDIFSKKLYTDNITARGNILAVRTDNILPSNNVSIGSQTNPIKNTYANSVYVDNINVIEEGSFSVSSYAAVGVYEKALKNIEDADEQLTDSDTVNVLSADGELNTVKFTDSLIPVGFIIMWSGNEIPNGWALCDGSRVNTGNGLFIDLPDMRGLFCVGLADGNTVGRKGDVEPSLTEFEEKTILSSADGSHSHDTGGTSLAIDNIPSHSHTYVVITSSGKSDSESSDGVYTSRTAPGQFDIFGGSQTHDHGSLEEKGEHSHSLVIPAHQHTVKPYEGKIYKLAYLMKVK